jgi:hypothetical protein
MIEWVVAAAAMWIMSEGDAPLDKLPSPPGAHVEKIQALGDDSWLFLGEPAADPKWGKALARGFHNRMAYAPDLRGAFLYGEGEHGRWDKPTGRYGDDLWFYDLQQHRWICLYPGTDVQAVNLKLDANGWEVDETGQPIPVAPMVHGYELSTYLPDRKKLMFLAPGGGYWKKAPFAQRRLGWLPDGGKSVKNDPFYYDVMTGRWEREKAKGDAGNPKALSSLTYLEGLNKTFHYRRRSEAWLYDHATRTWSDAAPKGTPPSGADSEGISAYDPERNWIFLMNVKEKVLPYIYDAKANAWVDPKPKNAPENKEAKDGVHPSSQHATLTYDSVSDVMVLVHHRGLRPPQKSVEDLSGLAYYVYDVKGNQWSPPMSLPKEFLKRYRRINAFYDPHLNVHVFHVGVPERTDGVIWVYRYKRGNP